MNVGPFLWGMFSVFIAQVNILSTSVFTEYSLWIVMVIITIYIALFFDVTRMFWSECFGICSAMRERGSADKLYLTTSLLTFTFDILKILKQLLQDFKNVKGKYFLGIHAFEHIYLILYLWLTSLCKHFKISKIRQSSIKIVTLNLYTVRKYYNVSPVHIW